MEYTGDTRRSGIILTENYYCPICDVSKENIIKKNPMGPANELEVHLMDTWAANGDFGWLKDLFDAKIIITKKSNL